MKKIAGYVTFLTFAVVLLGAQDSFAAVAQAIRAEKTSVTSGEVIDVTFTAPATVSNGTYQLSCPEGVEAVVDPLSTSLTLGGGGGTTISPITLSGASSQLGLVPCGPTYSVPNGATAPVLSALMLMNRTPVAQSVVLSYSVQVPGVLAPSVKKATIKVAPVVMVNKTAVDSASPVRLTFGFLNTSSAELNFVCPQGASVFYTKANVDLCQGTYLFTGTPVRPAYIDVTVLNPTREPVSVTPRLSFISTEYGYVSSLGQEVTVKTPVYFPDNVIKSKEAAKLVMAFPAKTKGTVKLDCYDDPELEFGLTTSFAGKCATEVTYAALPVNLSFTITNDTDEARSVTARVCAYINGATAPCVPFDSVVDVGASPSVIDLLLGAFSDAFTSWKPRFGDPTDKLVKTSVYKRTSSPVIVVAPEGATYAIVRAWGAAGGSFGNDNYSPYFALKGAKTNFQPGGYGGFVAGKIPVTYGDRFTFSAGAAGTRGTHKGDNNDDPGTPGGATRVSFNGKEVMVAGGGAQFLHTVAPTVTIIDPIQGLTARLEKIRVELSSGGSMYSGKTKAASGVTDAKRNEVVNIAKNSHGAPGMVTGGGGKVAGAWYVYPWFNNSYITALTGGTSWIDTAVVSNATYFAGNPSNNTSDKGAWEKYFRSSPRPGFPGYDAGHGGVVVEFWAPANVPEICTNGATDWPDCTQAALVPELTLSASPSTVVLGQAVNLSWTSLNSTTCTASSTAGAGTWSGPFATSGSQAIIPTTIGDKTYGMTCTGQGGKTVSDSTIVTVSTGDACTNGATNFPTCTTVGEPPECVNGATNPPQCTTGGTCSNGATNFPTCTTGGTCSNGATDWPTCSVSLSQGFTLGADRDIKIRTLPRGSATSDTVSIPVNRLGAFVGTVSAGIGGRSAVWPALPDDVEVSFSINGSPFSTEPISTDVLGSANSFNVAISISKRLPNTDYYISVTGTDPLGLLPQDFTLLRIVQTSVNPTYQEE